MRSRRDQKHIALMMLRKFSKQSEEPISRKSAKPSTPITPLRVKNFKRLEGKTEIPCFGIHEVLYPAEDGAEEIIGEIVDQQNRIPNYGPFTNSVDFYKIRTSLLSAHHDNKDPGSGENHRILQDDYKLELAAAQYIVEPTHNQGPFFLAHPDFKVRLDISRFPMSFLTRTTTSLP